ncbi:MAG: hypothetical protein KAR79_05170 [Simkaniaceae bacterium]|nr:hypothetical protein [Simkaniaceae bacterium]
MTALNHDVLTNILFIVGEPWNTAQVSKDFNAAQEQVNNTAILKINDYYNTHRDPLNIRQILDTTATPSKKLENIFNKLNSATETTAVSLPHASAEKHNARIKEIELHDLLTFWRFLSGADTYFSLPENAHLTPHEHACNFPSWLKNQEEITRVNLYQGELFYLGRVPKEIQLLQALQHISFHGSIVSNLPPDFFSLKNINTIQLLDVDRDFRRPQILLRLPSLTNIQLINKNFNMMMSRDSFIRDVQKQLIQEKHRPTINFANMGNLKKELTFLLILEKTRESGISNIPNTNTDFAERIKWGRTHKFDNMDFFETVVDEIQSGVHDELLWSFLNLLKINFVFPKTHSR